MKSMRYLPVAALSLLFFACADFSSYRYFHVYAMVKPSSSSSGMHEDSDLAFRFAISEKKIKAYITNKSASDVNIKWSEVAYIDFKGASHKVANNEVLFTNRMDKAKDTVLKPGITEENVIVPVDNVEKLEEQWTWSIVPLFDQETDAALLNRDKTFGVILPVNLATGEKVYRFEFKVAAVIPHRYHNPR
ncbi:MAG: hypothetical protein OEY64_08130 [Nitrospinota bacterium]|nr:hypothetical protein [Nitrospinota bacterium]